MKANQTKLQRSHCCRFDIYLYRFIGIDAMEDKQLKFPQNTPISRPLSVYLLVRKLMLGRTNSIYRYTMSAHVAIVHVASFR